MKTNDQSFHWSFAPEKMPGLFRSLVSNFPYATRSAAGGELRAWAGTIRARDRTASTTRSFRYQAINLYNQIPAPYRILSQNQFKSAVKKWARTNMT